MKSNTTCIYLASLFFLSSFFFSSCEGDLSPMVYDQISPSNFYKTRADVDAAVIGIYAELGAEVIEPVIMGEWGTDEYRNNSGGSESINAFDWKVNTNSGMYFRWVPAVTRAGAVLEIIRDLDFLQENDKLHFMAELRTARAIFMFDLLRWYGPCPVILDRENLLYPDNNYKPPRPHLETDEGKAFYQDYVDFIEMELSEAAEALSAEASEFGRFDRGTALTLLLKLHMHQRNWSAAESVSSRIIDLDKYELNADYNTIWTIQNEQNKEIIWAIPRTSNIYGQQFRARTLKTEYDITDESKWNMDKIRFDFLDGFDAGDQRKMNIIDEFVNKKGDTIDMRDETKAFYGAFCLKYDRDPDARENSGIDVINLRYADVLMCRAEALNELYGPTQEAVGLINQVRARAGLEEVDQSGFDQDSFRAHILMERGWEFWMEGMRRDDLIRHGKYISYAQDRGAFLAKDFHVLYPIPERAYIENEHIAQNPGYDF